MPRGLFKPLARTVVEILAANIGAAGLTKPTVRARVMVNFLLLIRYCQVTKSSDHLNRKQEN